MESYQIWFVEGPELSVLRMLGLFDRPTDEKALEALLRPPVIHGLTESLTDLRPTKRRTILAKLRLQGCSGAQGRSPQTSILIAPWRLWARLLELRRAQLPPIVP